MTVIPVADQRSPDFARQLAAACSDIGFVVLVGHGIPESTFAAMRDLLRRLFAVAPSAKERWAITVDNYRGFIPLGFFTPNRAEVNGTAPDWYEGFKLHWECPPDHAVMGQCPLYGPNRWPDDLPELADMRATVLAYWGHCDRVAGELLDVLAVPLGVEPSTLRGWHDAPLTNMTLLHYPPRSGPEGGPDRSGIHPHKDTNVVTLLHPDPVGGLEIRARSGRWLELESPDDALVVNVGEMLELWSGGEFVATPHRVVNRSGRERYSFPFFVVPNHDVVVAPLKPASADAREAGRSMDVGALSAEVWRTNWPDETPASGHDLGALDRSSI